MYNICLQNVVSEQINPLQINWECKVAQNGFWYSPWQTAGASGRFQAGPSCGGCACVTSWSPLARHEVRPRKAEAKDHRVEGINNPHHTRLNESPTVTEEFSVSYIRHMIHKPHQGILKH